MSDRAKRLVRAKIKNSGKYSVRVRITNVNIYADVIDPNGVVIDTVSSLSASFKSLGLKSGSNAEAAKQIGLLVGANIIKRGLQDKIAYDRFGRVYHKRLAALADAARSCGVNF